MQKFEYTITDVLGIHARLASDLAKLASQFQSRILIYHKDQVGDLKRVFSLLAVGAKKADTVKIKIEGLDEKAAAADISTFLKDNL
jgi:phosphocarrier protein